MARMQPSVGCLSSDEEDTARSPISATDTSSSIPASIVSAPTASLPHSTPTIEDFRENGIDMVQLKYEIEERAINRQTEWFDTWLEGRELLSPIPEEDETQCLPSVLSTIEDVSIEPLDESNIILLCHPDTGHVADAIFDLVPLDPMTSPYSWMVENHGKIPEKIQALAKKTRFNIVGENEVEWAIKFWVTEPEDYFLIATSVKFLVRLRYRKLITEQACASLLFRAVDGDARLWLPIKQAFFSNDVDFVRFPRTGVNQAVASLYDSVKKAQTMQFMKTLTRLVEALLVRSRADGYLVYKNGGWPVAKDLNEQQDLDISDDFMGRRGCSWTFENVSAFSADIFGVCELLKFEEVFGNAEYLARERAILNNDEAARQEKGAQKRWNFPVEEAREFLNDLFDEMDPECVPGGT